MTSVSFCHVSTQRGGRGLQASGTAPWPSVPSLLKHLFCGPPRLWRSCSAARAKGDNREELGEPERRLGGEGRGRLSLAAQHRVAVTVLSLDEPESLPLPQGRCRVAGPSPKCWRVTALQVLCGQHRLVRVEGPVYSHRSALSTSWREMKQEEEDRDTHVSHRQDLEPRTHFPLICPSPPAAHEFLVSPLIKGGVLSTVLSGTVRKDIYNIYG